MRIPDIIGRAEPSRGTGPDRNGIVQTDPVNDTEELTDEEHRLIGLVAEHLADCYGSEGGVTDR